MLWTKCSNALVPGETVGYDEAAAVLRAQPGGVCRQSRRGYGRFEKATAGLRKRRLLQYTRPLGNFTI